MIRWSHDSEFARLLDSNPAYPKNREYVGPVVRGESESIRRIHTRHSLAGRRRIAWFRRDQRHRMDELDRPDVHWPG